MRSKLEESCEFNFYYFYYGRNQALLEALRLSLDNLSIDLKLKKFLDKLFACIKDKRHLQAISQYGSPLLWSNIFSLITQNENIVSDIQHLSTLISLQLFDYYFYELDDMEVCLDITKDILFYFSSLNQTIFISHCANVMLIKKNNNLLISNNTHQKNYSANFASTKKANSNLQFSLISDPISDLSDFLTKGIDVNCDKKAFSNVLSKALKLISTLDPVLSDDIMKLIRIFFPLKLPDNIPGNERDQYSVSFSMENYIGVIFVSYTDNIFWLAETIIHEYAHNLLNIVMASSDLVKYSEKRFYSPWKNELRPAHGLLHALFSFSYAAIFMEKCLHVPLTKHQEEFIKNRLLIHAHRLNLGYRQDMHPDLTERGKKVYELMKHLFLTSEAASFLQMPCPNTVLLHAQAAQAG